MRFISKAIDRIVAAKIDYLNWIWVESSNRLLLTFQLVFLFHPHFNRDRHINWLFARVSASSNKIIDAFCVCIYFHCLMFLHCFHSVTRFSYRATGQCNWRSSGVIFLSASVFRFPFNSFIFFISFSHGSLSRGVRLLFSFYFSSSSSSPSSLICVVN